MAFLFKYFVYLLQILKLIPVLWISNLQGELLQLIY